MPWHPNNTSRHLAQQAQQHMHRHHQQLTDQQMMRLMDQRRAHQAHMGQPVRMSQQQDGAFGQPGSALTQPELPVPEFRGRPNAVLVLDVAIAAVVLIAIAVASVVASRAFSGGRLLRIGGGGAVARSVRTGSNVRQGPGTSFAVVAVLPSGTEVKVSCVDAGWARLASPYAGRYIAGWLLALTKNPKPCPARNAP
jgi:hypothetical protein